MSQPTHNLFVFPAVVCPIICLVVLLNIIESQFSLLFNHGVQPRGVPVGTFG